jgi:tripartite-type tricarboxylate transporter receptor subunit TctC
MIDAPRFLRAGAVALVACIAAVSAAGALAQTYPAKPVRLVVGFAPGGSTDVVARLIAKKLSERMGQSFTIDNRPGAGSNIATHLVATAPPDGYTLLFITSTQPVNVTLYPKLPYNLVEDFTGVAPATDIPSILVSHPSVPARTLKELIALAKAKPGDLTYASAGSGTATHLAAEMMKSMAGIDLRHIPYKGASPAMTDMIGGHVHIQFVFNAGLVMNNAKQGRLRAIAVASTKRLGNYPTLPTMDESGLKGFEATVWNGIAAPTGTPSAIVSRINAQTEAAMKELSDAFLEMGAYPMTGTPEQFTAFMRKEIVKWADVVKRSGARAE